MKSCYSMGAVALAGFLILIALPTRGPQAADEAEMPIVWMENWENGPRWWNPTDDKAWEIVKRDNNAIYHLARQSEYEPPHRSPNNISLLRSVSVSDFVLEVKVRSTASDYDHRSMCIFFGHQGESKFYYAHLGQTTDDHANQIFIVNDAERTKISTKTSEGTPWNDEWHNVKITRNVETGSIKVYFDDMENPVMEAEDKTFLKGAIGLGSFDDTGEFDDLSLRGVFKR